MKKILLLCLALLLLAGCGSTGKRVTFYYCSEGDDAYFSETGIIAGEQRILQEKQDNIPGLVALYLKGPMSPDLTMEQLPGGLSLLAAEEDGAKALTLTFEDSLAELSGIGLRVFTGCLAKTLCAYGDYEKVTFRAQSQSLEGAESLSIYPEKLVLADHSAGQLNSVLKLYFVDAQNQCLIEERRPAPEDEELSSFLLSALIGGPQSEQLCPTIPANTPLPSVSVSDGVCVVNFTKEFLPAQGEDEQHTRLRIYSVVNSLAQLEEVERVVLLVDDRSIEQYVSFELPHELTPDGTLIGSPK